MAKRKLKDSLPVIITSYIKANLTPVKNRFGWADFSAVFVADVHTDADPYRDRTDILRRAFSGIRSYGRPDVLCIAGDITNCGDEKEYALLKRLKKAYLSGIRVLPQMGNHDSWHHSDDPDYRLAEALFKNFCGECGFTTDKNYFYTEVSGYPFIVMGTEALCHNQPVLTDEQLEWFDRSLTRAEKTGNPIFVISHQPPNGRNGVPAVEDEAGIGEMSARVEEILHKHAECIPDTPILFFSGHLHKLRCDCVERDGNITYVNMPSLEYGDNKNNRGCGVALTVTGGKVGMHFINFITSERIDLF